MFYTLTQTSKQKSLTSHSNPSHSKPSSKQYFCRCNYITSDWTKFKEHKLSNHAPLVFIPEFACFKCGTFCSRKRIEKHNKRCIYKENSITEALKEDIFLEATVDIITTYKTEYKIEKTTDLIAKIKRITPETPNWYSQIKVPEAYIRRVATKLDLELDDTAWLINPERLFRLHKVSGLKVINNLTKGQNYINKAYLKITAENTQKITAENTQNKISTKTLTKPRGPARIWGKGMKSKPYDLSKPYDPESWKPLQA